MFLKTKEYIYACGVLVIVFGISVIQNLCFILIRIFPLAGKCLNMPSVCSQEYTQFPTD